MTRLLWTRRDWLARNAAAAAAVSTLAPAPVRGASLMPGGSAPDPDPAARLAAQAARLDPAAPEALAKRAVDAAKAAGAAYADVRLTRDVAQMYMWGARIPMVDVQTLGVGVRALVNGYWGFAGGTIWEPDEVTRLAQAAVRTATINARGPKREVELGQYPVATGRWRTPIEIDPFEVPMEEVTDTMMYWDSCAAKVGCYVYGAASSVLLARQERTVATTEGALFTQTLYETGGTIAVRRQFDPTDTTVNVRGIGTAGAGWERLLKGDIPGQMTRMPALLDAEIEVNKRGRPITIGSYTLVCDGATMAAMAARTFGVATQLDRALGYEANAGGTSYLDDPFAMLGQEKVAAPNVTITADRSMPLGLATVKWDDEGVEPDTATLVKGGVLTDYQTTRESSAWIKEYYAKGGKPVRSHGYATAGAGINVPLQQMPNIALAPTASGPGLDDLIAAVTDGVFIEQGFVRGDFQAKNGMLFGNMRFIKNGRMGPRAMGGAVMFSSADFWKKVTTVGGAVTQGAVGDTRYLALGGLWVDPSFTWWLKGQPPQLASHSAQGAAATITTQAVFDPSRRA